MHRVIGHPDIGVEVDIWFDSAGESQLTRLTSAPLASVLI